MVVASGFHLLSCAALSNLSALFWRTRHWRDGHCQNRQKSPAELPGWCQERRERGSVHTGASGGCRSWQCRAVPCSCHPCRARGGLAGPAEPWGSLLWCPPRPDQPCKPQGLSLTHLQHRDLSVPVGSCCAGAFSSLLGLSSFLSSSLPSSDVRLQFRFLCMEPCQSWSCCQAAAAPREVGLSRCPRANLLHVWGCQNQPGLPAQS